MERIATAVFSAPIEKNFAREEIMLPVKCNQHPWMKMYVNVVKNPFYAVTDKSGKYEIKGLPPGDYTMAFVHEKLGEQDQKVTVAPKDIKDRGSELQSWRAISRSTLIKYPRWTRAVCVAWRCSRRECRALLSHLHASRPEAPILKAIATPYNRATPQARHDSCLWTFLLIIAGALVTSNDAGLSVPDWPTSFGFLYKIPRLRRWSEVRAYATA